MDEAKRQLVQNWLIKAQHDLATARKLSTGPDPYLDTAIYHCQQVAEKVIKGFLVFQDQPFEKTHDIQTLIELAMPYHANFSQWLPVGGRMTHYGIAFRYPDAVMEPSQSQFTQALQVAEQLYAFVLSALPPETHP